MTKEEIKAREKELLEMVITFCHKKINEEYAQLCEKLVKKLGRKRDVPFKRGKIEIWAAAIVHAVGTLNFLFDKSFEPFMKVEQINEHFGTKNSTVSSKSSEIRDLLNLYYFDPDFSTRRISGSNPMNQLVMVDGLLFPVDQLPPDLQQMVKEARESGNEISFTTS